MTSAEYVFTRLSENAFKCAKFSGDAQPENVYYLTMRRKGEAGYDNAMARHDPQFHCDCPNRRRGKHINDKHGRMLSIWLAAGQPRGYFDETGEWHDAGKFSNPFHEALRNEQSDGDDSGGGEEGFGDDSSSEGEKEL